MTKLISEILKEASNAKTQQEKVDILRKNDSPALREVLKYLYHPGIKLYTNTPPAYKADHSPVGLSFSSLYNEYRTLYIFLEDSTVKKERKDQLLIQKLESMHPSESELLYQRFQDKLLLRLNKKVINEAFAGLIA